MKLEEQDVCINETIGSFN